MEKFVNTNLTKLHEAFCAKKVGAILEGSSRSGKTWSSIDFLVWLCSVVETNAVFNIIKETYNSFKTTLYDDFNRRLPQFGLSSPFVDTQNVSQFKMWGNVVHLLGADDEAKFHGASADYVYVNEALDISKGVWDQAEQRCRKFWWKDYNPKTTDHYVYDEANRPDVAFIKTTFKDNPHVSANERNKILSYDPNNPDNIKYGTADDFMWNVYGLGLRSAPEGVVFQHVTWIKEFPAVSKVYYGADLGYTNSPSTLVRVGVHKNSLYLEKLFYQPTPSSNELVPLIKEYNSKGVTWMDSADPAGMISECRRKGLQVFAVKKYPGSIKHGISMMKRYKVHIVDCAEWRKEQSNYKYREINGFRLDEPVDEFNHLWDAARYAVMSNLRV